MNTVIKHIEYLISRKECVIIPGVGAVLALDLPAKVVPETGVIIPPTRTYSFNSDLSVSDGALVASIARDLSISFETASRRVEQATESIMDSLRSTGSFALGSLGVLQYDNTTHSISFEVSDSQITCSRNFWLQPVILPVVEDTIQNGQAPYPVTIEKRSFLKRVIRVAASIALLIGLCFIASTPVAVQDAALASLAPDLRQLTQCDFQTSHKDNQLTIFSPAQKPSESPIEIINTTIENDDEYMIVVGTLRNMSEAEIFCDKYSGQNLHIYQHGKFVRVYTESFPTREEAVISCRSTHKVFPDAWIYKKI